MKALSIVLCAKDNRIWRTRECEKVETGKRTFHSALRVEFATNHSTYSYEHHSNRPELKLLTSSSLRLSVLNLTTPQPCTLHLRKSSLLRLLRDFVLLLSLLLDVVDAHASNGALHLERLLASLLALLSSLLR